jgi:hypothetical protein
MHFTRRRTDRPDQARRGLGSGPEVLESRELLSSSPNPFSPWRPFELPVFNPITHQPVPLSEFTLHNLIDRHNPQSPLLNNEGKVVSGKDRQGNEWTITVHGPGVVIVTDTTPADGILDDDINTIQLIGTDPNRTYVIGSVVPSFRTPTDGTVLFNKLIDTDGVKSVLLNGFTLTQTIPPLSGGLNNTDTGVFLYGGVQTLSFHDILASIDQATLDQPINIIIGDPSTPLTVQPTIKLDSIFNTVFNSTAATVPVNPQTDPTVNIVVNGQIKGLDFISSTQHPSFDVAQSLNAFEPRTFNPTLSPIAGAAEEFNFPIVGTTGRTAIRATGIDTLHVRGSAINVTASRGQIPFQNSLSGLTHIGHATFGGNADALGLDVDGPIGALRFNRGLGSPVGTKLGPPTSSVLDATTYGTPAHDYGYPASNLLGGLVTATNIQRLTLGPANTILQTPTNPDLVQLFRQGTTTFFPSPGQALTSSAIVSSGSIGRTHIRGSQFSSEIKTGFDYPSFAAGLEGTRAPSQIGPYRQHGDVVDSVISATYRPFDHMYQTPADVAGPGTIRGNLHGNLIVTGAITALGNHSYNDQGVGFFARRKIGYLPPPESPRRGPGSVLKR